MVQFINMPAFRTSPLLDLAPINEALAAREAALDRARKARMQQAQFDESKRQFDAGHALREGQFELQQRADVRQERLLPGQIDSQSAATEAARARTRLTRAQAAEAENPRAAFERRAQLAQQHGLQPGSEPFRQYVLNGKLPTGQARGLSKGQEAVDRAFAKEYVEFQSGGAADASKNLEQLTVVEKELSDIAKGKSKNNLTGPVVGMVPDQVQAFINPKALDRRELVEEVVQRNLRLVLGAQFTQKEGDRLIARAYNPRLGEAENAERISRLRLAIEKGIAAKNEMSQYFEANGSLAGYKGPRVPSITAIESFVEGKGAQVEGEASANTSSRVPQAALDFLRANPTQEMKRQFQEHYGVPADQFLKGAR